MRNSIKFVLICFAVACGIAIGLLLTKKPSADTEQEPAETTAAVSEVHVVAASMPENITMKIPSGFQETSSEYYDTYYVCQDASIIITGEEVAVSGTSLIDYTDQMQRIYRQTTDNFTLIDDEMLTVNNEQCRIMEFTYDIIGETTSRTMHCMTAYFLKNDYAYVITCKSGNMTYSSYQSAFRNAVNSVKIAGDSVETAAAVPAVSVPAETTLP
ncbi:MAG: hypothetical protein MJ062_00980 [Oscillospiraceae bacterium]|nr:hypothetical protein [Oscillospiraceae bacterium]